MTYDPLGLLGTTIAEKYAIESIVGEGGFAIVYRATHLVWKRPVAVKVFKALGEVTADRRQALLDDFIQEGALLGELSEKTTAICQARDVGMTATANGQTVPYMVLEWLEGKSLEDVLDDEARAGTRPRTVVEMVRLLGPIADALALAHARGISHRDVKPANIFVLGDPRATVPSVKLLDFGIAKVVSDVEKMGLRSTSGALTSFTPLYGAPEQFNRSYGTTGPWTDVFALALVAGEVLAGRTAMTGESVIELSVTASNPLVRPTPRSLGVSVSAEVERIFERALAVQPTERWGTAGEFWEALCTHARRESQRTMTAPKIDVAIPDLDLTPRTRLSGQMTAVRPSGQMAGVVPDLMPPRAPAPRLSGQMAAPDLSPSSRAPVASPASPRGPAAPFDPLPAGDDFYMEIERGDAHLMPVSADQQAVHSISRASRPMVPIASTGLGLAARPSGRSASSETTGEVSTGLATAAWAVSLIVAGAAAFGLLRGAKLRPLSITQVPEHAFDGSSAIESGAVAVAALIAAIAIGWFGVKGTPRSWPMVGGAGALLLISLAMVTVALGATGEATAPPDGVLLLPYLSPLVVLGIGLGALARAAWLFQHRVISRKLAALPVAALAGALLAVAWLLAPFVRR